MLPAELVIGQPYFTLGYFDEDFTFPLIMSFVYVGQDLLEASARQGTLWYFQDAASYVRWGAFRAAGGRDLTNPMGADAESTVDDGTTVDPTQLYTFPTEQLRSILSREQLARKLLAR